MRASSLTPGQRKFLLSWTVFLAAAGGAALLALASRHRADRLEAEARHAARLVDAAPEAERTPPAGHERDVPSEVKVGIYLDRIYELSVVGSTWKGEFFVWFIWTDPKLNPGETFNVVNGEILSRNLLVKKRKGAARYALYKVTAQITKAFDVARFPRDDHMLRLSLEDGARQSYQLRYAADAHSDVSSRVFVPGYKIWRKAITVNPHAYRTSRGDLDLPSDFKATYSMVTYSVSISRPGWGLHFKMFTVMYAAVLIALLGLFIRSSCDRLALVAGSFFAAVANVYITSSLIPDTGSSSLADELNGVGVVVISLVIVQGIIYQYYFEGREDRAAASRLFDQATFWILLALYAALNIVVPVVASV